MTAPDISLSQMAEAVEHALQYAGGDYARNLRAAAALIRAVERGELVRVVLSGMTDAEGNVLYYKDERSTAPSERSADG